MNRKLRRKTFLYSIFSVSVAILSLTGCTVFDSQVFSVGSEAWNTVNPAFPLTPSVLRAQAQHQVLVGIMDSGVDYLHPALQNQMHYQTNANRSVGLGFDFAGNDTYPAPRLWLEDKRVIEIEQSGALAHGTHVAGIVAQRDYRIGIVPYRIIPMDKTTPREKVIPEIFNRFAAALRLARLHGVRVVNISMGVDTSNMKMSEQQLRQYSKAFEEILKLYSHDILAVIAAGNETLDISSGMKVSPCAIRSGNVLCVGSTNQAGAVSSFSNVGNQFVDVYFPGEDILSTVSKEHDTDEVNDGLMKMSGTSMASPGVAHIAASVLIHKPCLNALQVADIIKKSALLLRTNRKVGTAQSEVYAYRLAQKDAAIRFSENVQCSR